MLELESRARWIRDSLSPNRSLKGLDRSKVGSIQFIRVRVTESRLEVQRESKARRRVRDSIDNIIMCDFCHKPIHEPDHRLLPRYDASGAYRLDVHYHNECYMKERRGEKWDRKAALRADKNKLDAYFPSTDDIDLEKSFRLQDGGLSSRSYRQLDPACYWSFAGGRRARISFAFIMSLMSPFFGRGRE